MICRAFAVLTVLTLPAVLGADQGRAAAVPPRPEKSLQIARAEKP